VSDCLVIAAGLPAPFLVIGSLVFGQFFGDDDPPRLWGNGHFAWNADGSLGMSIVGGGGDDDGGALVVRSLMDNVQESLQGIVAHFKSQDPDARIGIIPNRLPSISYDDGHYGNVGLIPWSLVDLDPVTGQDRAIYYDASEKAVGVAVGAPEFFRLLGEQFVYSALGHEAIAPQWEVDTARLQANAGSPQAGLTELQRAQRNGRLTPALSKDATTENWRPVMLDAGPEWRWRADSQPGRCPCCLRHRQRWLPEEHGLDQQPGWLPGAGPQLQRPCR
jgi:hypothetical protein